MRQAERRSTERNMELYITELSKYVITMLMALYAYESFAVFRYQEEERRSGIYTRQNFLMLLIHFSCFLVICFETGDMSYLFFYAFQQAVLFATAVLFHMVYPGANRLIVNHMCLLLSVGFVMLTRLSYERAVRQFVIAAVSIAVVMVIPFFVHKLKFLKSLTWVYAFAGIAALTVVLVLGSYTYGSKISYTVAGVTVQPSEFVKIIFVFFLAGMLCGSASFLQVCLTAVVAGIHVVILVFSKDLGSALIFFVVYVLMVFVATGNPLYLLAGEERRLPWQLTGCFPMCRCVSRRGRTRGAPSIREATRLPSRCLPSAAAAGLGLDCSGGRLSPSLLWRRILFFPPWRRSWASCLPCA